MVVLISELQLKGEILRSGGVIGTLGDDIRKLLQSTSVLMKNPYRVKRILNNGATINPLYGDSNITTSDVVSVILPENATTLSSNCFRECTSLESIHLPDTTQRIGAHALYHCYKVFGDLELPESVTYIGPKSFHSTNISSINGGNVVNADTVYLDSFCNTKIDNLTINADTVINGSLKDETVARNGTLTINCTTLYINGNGEQNSSKGGMLSYQHIVVNGNINFNSGNFYRHGWSPNVGTLKSYKISGNITANNSLIVGLYNDTVGLANFEFLEVGGTISGLGSMNGVYYGLFYTDTWRSMSSNTIVHLSYNGLACTIPNYVGAHLSRVKKIYVGDGSSEEHDNSILALYTANSGWASYTSKLDTWYNYVQSGGTYA